MRMFIFGLAVILYVGKMNQILIINHRSAIYFFVYLSGGDTKKKMS